MLCTHTTVLHPPWSEYLHISILHILHHWIQIKLNCTLYNSCDKSTTEICLYQVVGHMTAVHQSIVLCIEHGEKLQSFSHLLHESKLNSSFQKSNLRRLAFSGKNWRCEQFCTVLASDRRPSRMRKKSWRILWENFRDRRLAPGQTEAVSWQ